MNPMLIVVINVDRNTDVLLEKNRANQEAVGSTCLQRNY